MDSKSKKLGLPKNQLIMVIVLISGSLISVLNQSSVTPLLPEIMSEMNVNTSTAQWLVSGFNLVNALIIPITAYLMARFSTRKLFFSAFSLFFAGNILMSIGANFPMLLAGRFLQAACAGVLMPMVMTILMLVFPIEHRGLGMGIYNLVVLFAPAIGPSLAGILSDKIGWRLFFVIMAVIAVVVMLVAAVFLKNYENEQAQSFDALSVILSSTGLLCLLYGFSEVSNRFGLAIALIVVGIIIVLLFGKRQLKLEKPILEIRVLKEKQFLIGLITIMIYQIMSASTSVTLPLYLQTVREMSATTTGIVMMPAAIAGALAALLAGKLSDKFSVRPVAIAGGIALTIGSLGMGFWGNSTHIAVITISYMILMIGVMLSGTPLTAWTLSALENNRISHGTAVLNTLRQVAASMGTAIMTSVMALVMMYTASGNTVQAQLSGLRTVFILGFVICTAELITVLLKVKNKC